MKPEFDLYRPLRPLGHPTRRPVQTSRPRVRVLTSNATPRQSEGSLFVVLAGAVLLVLMAANLIRNLI